MPRVQRHIGDGITRRAILELHAGNSEDLKIMEQAAIAALDLTSFDRLSRKLKESANGILRESALDLDAEALSCLGKRIRGEPLTVTERLLLAGYPWQIFEEDTPEGYSVRILLQIDKALSFRKSGQIDEAMAAAFQTGQLVAEASYKAAWEPDALRGAKVAEGGRRGHAAAYGSEDEHRDVQAAYVASFEKFRAERQPVMSAMKAAAKLHGVSTKTIERARRQIKK
jgi:hypothetical protein